MKSTKQETVPIASSSDVVVARQKVRQWAIEMKFTLVDQTKLVTAASELARNALEHGNDHVSINRTVVPVDDGLVMAHDFGMRCLERT